MTGLGPDARTAHYARGHDDAGVLGQGALVAGDGVAQPLLATFPATASEGGRHGRGVARFAEIEEAGA